jgi:hypothetical protein
MGFETKADRSDRLDQLKLKLEEYADEKIELIEAEADFLKNVLSAWGVRDTVASFKASWQEANIDEFFNVG